jgi:hypothetical protein
MSQTLLSTIKAASPTEARAPAQSWEFRKSRSISGGK